MNVIIKTDRLELSPFTSIDEKLFLQLNTDAYIRKYLWDDESIEPSKAKELIHQNKVHFKDNQFSLRKIHLHGNNKIIGFAGLWYFFSEPQPQLIYALLKEFTKNGYAHEACISIVDYAFNQLGFKYLIAATYAQHIESQKVAKGLRMSLIKKRMKMGSRLYSI